MSNDNAFFNDYPLCFIEAHNAIKVMADSVGQEARKQLVAELLQGWVDELPDSQLSVQYQTAVNALDDHDLSLLAAWHASFDSGQAVANKDFLIKAFPTLGDNRREALKIAAGFRGEEAVSRGLSDELLDSILADLSPELCRDILEDCVSLYCWDRLGSDN